jgi:hypothetical protein
MDNLNSRCPHLNHGRPLIQIFVTRHNIVTSSSKYFHLGIQLLSRSHWATYFCVTLVILLHNNNLNSTYYPSVPLHLPIFPIFRHHFVRFILYIHIYTIFGATVLQYHIHRSYTIWDRLWGKAVWGEEMSDNVLSLKINERSAPSSLDYKSGM